MKVSVCITTLNEEKTIRRLLEGLLLQTLKPDEVVIVDGGSTDSTLLEISKFKKQITNQFTKFKILQISGASIAVGRNKAIRMATGEIIATTDAGCRLKKDWLEKITKPFEDKKVDAVAGFYRMTGVTPVSRAAAPFLGVLPERYDRKTFLPSARSMAFRKRVWKDVKGFSEKLDRAGEDSLFVAEILKKGYQIEKVKGAIVYWETPGNIKELFFKFYYYAKGDAQSKIWRHPSKKYMSHNIHILLIFFRYFLFILLPFIFLSYSLPYYWLFLFYFSYLIWPIYKFRDLSLGWRVKVLMPFVQILSDVAVMCGFINGLKVQ